MEARTESQGLELEFSGCFWDPTELDPIHWWIKIILVGMKDFQIFTGTGSMFMVHVSPTSQLICCLSEKINPLRGRVTKGLGLIPIPVILYVPS